MTPFEIEQGKIAWEAIKQLLIQHGDKHFIKKVEYICRTKGAKHFLELPENQETLNKMDLQAKGLFSLALKYIEYTSCN